MLDAIIAFIKSATKSWKSSLAGLLALGTVVLYAVHYIGKEEMAIIIGTLTGLGFLVTKDNNKTGV